MSLIVLEERMCSSGCGTKFKVLQASTQYVCSVDCTPTGIRSRNWVNIRDEMVTRKAKAKTESKKKKTRSQPRA